MDARPSPRHLAALDVVRFAAAMAVVAYHYLFRGAVDERYVTVRFDTGTLFGIGVEHLYLGVHLFFAVSGYVIMASVRERDAFRFAQARFVRLWPSYALCMTLTAVVLLWIADPRFPVDGATWAANLTFLAPLFGKPFVDGVYWSIVVEIVFYGWVALLMLARVLPRHLLPFAAAWLLLASLNELWLRDDGARWVLLTRFAPWFLFGVLLHDVARHGLRFASVTLLAGTVALSFHNVVVEQREVAALYGVAIDPQAVVTLNAVLLLLFTFALGSRLTARPWLLTLGALTYPLYLLHQNIGYIVLERLAPLTGKHAALAVTVAGALLLAWAVDRWWDRPVRRALARTLDGAFARLPTPLRPRTA